MMCQACTNNDHANCGTTQTWCECDCDPEAANLPTLAAADPDRCCICLQYQCTCNALS